MVSSQQEMTAELVIYVTQHCPICHYAFEVADDIREQFPDVNLRIVDMEITDEEIPDRVFATPTYLLNGRVWSLGNPSQTQVMETFGKITQ
jgi:hypothetical protein